ncbi:sugar MFS transporter [Paraflavisolibacter sp. H34]|uniref:sugar MFS transporter n=1 Tax=Huijunlia imazamoxiresistens TaxID=3127457 RepID=UPI003018AE73
MKAHTTPKQNQGYFSSLTLIGLLFFTFGFITWVNGSLIQFLKIACGLEGDVQAFLVTFAFYMAYFALALPAAFLLKKTGYKNGMAMGLIIMALGSLVFIPAAILRDFNLFLIGLFLQGSGLALLQTASNPYISSIGPMESAAKRISIMGICNKAAGMIAPLVLSALLMKNAGALETKLLATPGLEDRNRVLEELSGRVILPYFLLAVVLLLLAVLIWKSALPEVETEPLPATEAPLPAKRHVFQFRHLLLGVLCVFLYVGAEVMAGDAIGVYGSELGISIDQTKYFTTFTLVAMLLGYIIGIYTIPKKISQQTALKYSALLGIFLTVAIYFATGYYAICGIALLGLANALVWPALFPLAIAGLGRFTQVGSALLIMGISGGALMPLLYATLKEEAVGWSNPAAFFACTLPAYLYILYYALRGHKVQ